ncbi:MAG: hypothetical protein QG622_2344, partial [Actinomycetota bacterium]|nr:hypothetical protein [Actinomycetota bacterium]
MTTGEIPRRLPWSAPVPWDVPDTDAGSWSGGWSDGLPGDPARPLPVLIGLQYLRASLRRRWMVLVVGALLGTLAGAAFPAVVPAGRSATTTLYLSHDPTADQARAMA